MGGGQSRPLEQAAQTNRMSPPGVVMTYGSDDWESSLAEIACKLGKYAVVEFVTERNRPSDVNRRGLFGADLGSLFRAC